MNASNAAQEAGRMISLETSTPVMTILKDHKQTSMLLSMNHAIFDLRSLKLLISEIVAALEDRQIGNREGLTTAVHAHFNHRSPETDIYWNDSLASSRNPLHSLL